MHRIHPKICQSPSNELGLKTFHHSHLTFGRIYFFDDIAFIGGSAVAAFAQVVSSGVVMVWFENAPNTNPGIFTQLPYRFRFAVGTEAWNFHPQVLEGAISVYFFKEDLTNPAANLDPLTPAQPDRLFRWVIIPPAAASIAEGFPPDLSRRQVLEELAEYGFHEVDRY